MRSLIMFVKKDYNRGAIARAGGKCYNPVFFLQPRVSSDLVVVPHRSLDVWCSQRLTFCSLHISDASLYKLKALTAKVSESFTGQTGQPELSADTRDDIWKIHKSPNQIDASTTRPIMDGIQC